MPIRNALPATLLLAGFAGSTCACADPPTTSNITADTAELRLAYARLGMSEPLAGDCAALALITRPARDPEELSDEAPTSDPLRLTRAQFLQVYCDGYAATGIHSGWEACLEGGSVLTPLTATPHCVAQTQPYLACLARADTDSRDSCHELVPEPSCDPTVPVRPGSAAILWCAGGQFGLDGIECPSRDEDEGRKPLCTAYNQGLTNCPDGRSYQFLCAPPDAACSIQCSCAQAGATTREVTVAGVHDAEFAENVWSACGFPEIPAALQEQWRAERPTLSVYDQPVE